MVIKKEHYFYAEGGAVLKNLNDLLDFLKNANDLEIEHHFNSEKNDFANWTKDILKEKALSKSLAKAANRDDMIIEIEKRIKAKSQKKPKTKKDIISQIKGAISNE